MSAHSAGAGGRLAKPVTASSKDIILRVKPAELRELHAAAEALLADPDYRIDSPARANSLGGAHAKLDNALRALRACGGAP